MKDLFNVNSISAGSAKSRTGDILCEGNIGGDAKSHTGDISANTIKGKSNSFCGKVSIWKK